MRRKEDTWFWNTGQVKVRWYLVSCLLLFYSSEASAHPDFLDSMSRQFFGVEIEDNRQQNHQQHRQDPDPFSQMFGSHSQPVQSRPPPPNRLQRRPPQRQGYYAPHPVEHHPHYQVHNQPQHYPSNYNGPPPVYGQQQGFGQVKTDGNETKTEGFPRDGSQHKTLPHYAPHPLPPQVSTEYHIQHQPAAVEYHQPPNTAVEYHHQEPVEYHHQPPVEYHHAPPHPVEYHQPHVVEEHHGTEILSDPHHHPHHEVVEYHHPPPVEYHHHHPTHKPKSFHLSFNQPSPDLKIIDKHLKLPPVKFRFHINPKILITTNTKDPLDKKHHDDEHDLEPYPPPDAFSDHEAPPSYNEHTIEKYPIVHHEHYPVAHHEVGKHYPIAYPEAKHYPIEHHAVAHHPSPHEYTYDLSGGHSHLNPHRSSGHYEPTFKIKTRPIIFTEPPPTKPTTTPRPTTTTSRTTTSRTTTTTTTARPTRSRSRARLNARNPGFSVAFTQASTSATTSIERQGDASEATTSATTTRRSMFGSNPEREKEGGGISARKDDQPAATTSLQTSTTSTTSTTMKPTTTTTTTQAPTTSSTTTTTTPATTTTTTTTPKPTTTSTTTTQRPTTTSTTTTKAMPTTTSTARAPPTSRSTSNTPAEETTPRTTTTLNVGSNEIDMRKTSESPRRRLEPLKEESLTTIERSESFNIESSESVKVIETTMLIDGKNQTVKFYYITQPVKLPLDLFQKMTGQKSMSNGMSVVKIREKRFVSNLEGLQPILNE